MTAEKSRRIRELEEENAALKARLHERDVAMRRTLASYLSDEVLEEVLEKDRSVRIGASAAS